MACELIEVVVVGGGRVGTRKALSFHDAGASVKVIASRASDTLLAAVGPRFTVVEKSYGGPDDIGAAEIVIAATDDPGVNAAVARDARGLHRLVNVVDKFEEGSFTSMAVHRSGNLLMGVSAGGVPAAAMRIRDSVAERFDGRYADALGSLEELRRTTLAQDRGDWPRVASELLGSDFCASVESGEFGKGAA